MCLIFNIQTTITSIFLAALTLPSLNEALRILVVFPMSAKSHNILGVGVVDHLLDAGHEVVYTTSFPRNKPIPRLKEIDVSSIGQEFISQSDKFEAFKLKNLVGKGNIASSFLFMYFTYDFHKKFLEHEEILKLLSDPKENFDVVILEWFFSQTLVGIPPLFQCPLIWLGSTEAHGQVLRLIDETPNPAYTVDLFSTSIPPLTFWERTVELWFMIKKYLITTILIEPYEKSVYYNAFPEIAARRNVALPSYEEAVYNGSLLLLNSHPSIGTPYRLPQNAKYIAGYHIDSKVQPLPQNLQKIMDDSKHGVIYFSMGSNLKSVDMSEKMKESLFKLFEKLKQTIIWKFESDIKNVSSNVHLISWAPQQSILSHPKMKIFITHGGQLSTTEAIHYGVPVIGIPVMGDQDINMKSVQNKGFGITLNLADDLADYLGIAIQEMLTNDSYKNKAMELSLAYHDRLSSPGAELVHWVEHVVRTRGAPHLRSPALLVPWYQKMYLDLAAVLFLIFAVSSTIVKCFKSNVFKKGTNKSSQKGNKDKTS